ncbi:MAG: IclR family transcriptional regulator [Anaerolineaceae bacterium]|nr:IclR family transcriptional regulator [Anaerolineaceae bacterium]
MKTVRKALEIIKLVEDNNGELNDIQLAQLIKTNKTSVYKISAVLCEYGYLQRLPGTTRYCLGKKLYTVNNPKLSKTKLLSVARPIMQQLANESNDTVNLLVQYGTRGIYIEVIESKRSARLASSVGEIDFLHISAVGKMILSGMSEDEIDRIIEIEGLPKTGKNTITTPEDLKKELKIIRANGFAFDREESVAGARCVAAPIRDFSKLPIAGISISSLTVSITDEEYERNKILVTKAAKEISEIIEQYVYVNID